MTTPTSTKKTAKKTARKKTAKKKAARKRGNTAKRYSDALKSKIIEFVNSVNMEKGRGGVAAAAKKFGASPLSISKWLKQGGSSAAKSRGPRRAAAVPSGRDNLLSELTSLNRTIASKRKELDSLEARFDKLKSAL